MKLSDDTKIILAGSAVALIALWYAAHRAGQAVGSVFDFGSRVADSVLNGAAVAAESINPASDKNLVYRSVNGLGSVLSGQTGWTVGGAVYDLTHTKANGGVW